MRRPTRWLLFGPSRLRDQEDLVLGSSESPPTCPAQTPDPVTAWMAVAGSGVSPRQATMEAPVLPANRHRRRQPPDRTRESMPLSEKRTPIPSPDSGAGPAARGTLRTTLAASSSNALSAALRPAAPPATQVRLAAPGDAGFATGQCTV